MQSRCDGTEFITRSYSLPRRFPFPHGHRLVMEQSAGDCDLYGDKDFCRSFASDNSYEPEYQVLEAIASFLDGCHHRGRHCATVDLGAVRCTTDSDTTQRKQPTENPNYVHSVEHSTAFRCCTEQWLVQLVHASSRRYRTRSRASVRPRESTQRDDQAQLLGWPCNSRMGVRCGQHEQPPGRVRLQTWERLPHEVARFTSWLPGRRFASRLEFTSSAGKGAARFVARGLFPGSECGPTCWFAWASPVRVHETRCGRA